MMLRQFKRYTSHHTVNVGDEIMFKCKGVPKNTKLHIHLGDVQIWNVTLVENNGVRLLKKNSLKNIEMVLHDVRIKDGILSLTYFGELYTFELSYSNAFHFREYISNIISKFKNRFS